MLYKYHIRNHTKLSSNYCFMNYSPRTFVKDKRLWINVRACNELPWTRLDYRERSKKKFYRKLQHTDAIRWKMCFYGHCNVVNKRKILPVPPTERTSACNWYIALRYLLIYILHLIFREIFKNDDFNDKGTCTFKTSGNVIQYNIMIFY